MSSNERNHISKCRKKRAGIAYFLPSFLPSFLCHITWVLAHFQSLPFGRNIQKRSFFFFCQLCFPGYQHHHHTHKLNCILKTSYKHKENNSQFTFILKKSLKSLWQATILDTPQQADTQEFNIHFSETIFSLLDSAPKTAFKSNSSIWHQHFWQSDYR